MTRPDGPARHRFRLLDGVLVLRPELALGVARPATIQSDNAGYPLGLHVAPGALVGLRLAPAMVTAEVRRDLIPGWSHSTSLLFGAGVVF